MSTEITGYHASTLAWLHTATNKQEALERAVQTAEFLVNCAWDPMLRIFPFEHPDASPAYFFDCGIIIRGLLAVWRITGTDRYLAVAQACGRQMAEDFDAGFDFHPILDLPRKTPSIRDPRWSRSSGCYQLKAALAWRELASAGSSKELLKVWDRVLSQSLDHHDQFLPGHSEEEKVMDRLHAYCYFLEGLVVGHDAAHAANAIAIGVQRVAYLLHTIAPVFVRSDVYAQLLRIRLYAEQAGILALDIHTAALEAERLAAFQLSSSDARIDGGFCFGRKGAELLPYVNPVSTDFGLQALFLWHTRQAGKALPPVSGLV